MDNFNKEFDKQFKKTTRTVWTVFIVNALIGLTAIGVIAYVAIHFLQKLW